MIRYSSISTTWQDYPSKEDNAILIYFSGCTHNCKGCHNPDLLIKNNFKSLSIQEFYDKIIELCDSNRTNKVVLEGGDPLSPNNIESTRSILNNNYKKFLICVYTGYSIDYVKDNNIKGFEFIKCGRYEIDNKCESYKNDVHLVLASKNQRLYDKNYNQVSNKNVYTFKG